MAFFSAAVIDVPAVALFGIFCGILIAVDYVLCVLLLSPVLCLYDKRTHNNKNKHWLLKIPRLRRRNAGSEEEEEAGDATSPVRQSFIHRVLEGYFYLLHKFRYLLLLGSIAVTGWCCFVASQLQTPQDDPRPSFLLPNNRYELHSTYAANLIANEIVTQESPKDKVQLVFGVEEVDNGFHLDSNQPGTLAYDNDFDPANSQLYLLDMCERVFSDGVLKKPTSDYNCSLKEFDIWLGEESQLESPSKEYDQSCNGATSIPVDTNTFHQCIIAFSVLTNSSEVYHENGQVKAIVINTLPVRNGFTMQEVGRVWRAVESWSEEEKQIAPTAAKKWFISSFTFWFYDTFNNMSASALSSALISMTAAALMIILTSHSFMLCIYSTIAIMYILVGVTASLVALGWELGLFESVLCKYPAFFFVVFLFVMMYKNLHSLLTCKSL